MDWRTSHVEKRRKTEPTRHGSLAVVAGGDFTPDGARLWLGAALIGDLQVARRAGQRFGAVEQPGLSE
jgi:hypothetical protein